MVKDAIAEVSHNVTGGGVVSSEKLLIAMLTVQQIMEMVQHSAVRLVFG